MELFRKCKYLVSLCLRELGYRNACPLGYDLGDLILIYTLMYKLMAFALALCLSLLKFLLKLRKFAIDNGSGLFIRALTLKYLCLIVQLFYFFSE